MLRFLKENRRGLQVPLRHRSVLTSFFYLRDLGRPIKTPDSNLGELHRFFSTLVVREISRIFLPWGKARRVVQNGQGQVKDVLSIHFLIVLSVVLFGLTSVLVRTTAGDGVSRLRTTTGHGGQFTLVMYLSNRYGLGDVPYQVHSARTVYQFLVVGGEECILATHRGRSVRNICVILYVR